MTNSGRALLGLIGILSLLVSAAPAPVPVTPPGFTETLVTGGLTNPTAMTFTPDGRILICQQGGSLRVFKDGQLLAAPFLTVTVSSVGERGLLGVAVDPDFATSQHVYVYYTATTPAIHNRVSRFTASGDVAVPGSETVLLDLPNLSAATNHNGGAMHFGLDGKLYIAVGDNANGANSQSLATRLGKMLRVNADGTIPADNPFFGTATGVNRAVWALGLRNPFTFAFQPGTGRMFINDVGQNTWEEVNDGIAGANYGWPLYEGVGGDPSYADPIYAYGHTGSPSGCAITGGTFYNPAAATFPPQYVGQYFFADFCSGWIRRLDPVTYASEEFATGIASPVDLKVGPDGALYYLKRGGGAAIWKIQFTAGQAPTISAHPQSLTVSVGQPATFAVTAGGTPPLSYQWQRGGVDIPGAVLAAYTLPSSAPADNGAPFRAVVTNAFGSATSDAATLTVTANQPPAAVIAAPAVGATYRAGDTIAYAGSATDPEDGPLPAAAFTWTVDFHHEDHVHPFLPAASGATGGSFTIPTVGETSVNVWYRIRLSVTDSGGLTNEVFRDVTPVTSTVTVVTSPPGLQITVDGQPFAAPYGFASVVGMTRTLGAVTPQDYGGATVLWLSWSDAGAATHTIQTPETGTTFTATFRAAVGTGTGLRGDYYNFAADWWDTFVLSRVDSRVTFTWTGSPAPGVTADNFSVLWQGWVQPRFSQNYTFYSRFRQGVNLWLYDPALDQWSLVISDWIDGTAAERASAPVPLEAGRYYYVWMEFYHTTGTAVVDLKWSSPSQAKQVIPRLQLYPP